MGGLIERGARMVVGVLAGALVGIAGWLALLLVNIANPTNPWPFVWAAAVAGFGGWLGFELGCGRSTYIRAARGRETMPMALWLLLCMIGLLGGILLALIVQSRAAPALFVSTSGMAIFGFALVSGLIIGARGFAHMLTRSSIGLALGVFCGVAVALGYGLATSIAYGFASPCAAAHKSCLDPGPWQGFSVGFIFGPAVGLWLGSALWLALSMGSIVHPLSHR